MKLTSTITTILLALGLTAMTAVEAGAAPAKGKSLPSFAANPGLSPAFAWNRRDYVVRCESSAVRFRVKAPGKWKGRVGSPPRRERGFKAKRSMKSGSKVTVRFRAPGGRHRNFYVRCLPDDFPEYEFRRMKPGGPRLFAMQFAERYAAIISRDGAPVWWYQDEGFTTNVQFMPDGNMSWAPVEQFSSQQGAYEIRSLRGKLIRTVTAADGLAPDVHELLQLNSGNYLTGAFRTSFGVDTTPFGGSADTSVLGAVIQELRPDGSLVWSWDSSDHIDLAETGRWWPQMIKQGQPYDAVHWNSVERNGDTLLMSFRHLDGVYKIDRATGNVIWKLGGTETPESLEVLGDPEGAYPFGGQHDIRQDKNGTVTIFDNDTGLDRAPRAVRYKINEKRGTAKLITSIDDPKAPASLCCGSADRLGSGEWLVGWGGVITGRPLEEGVFADGLIGAYDRKGKPIFRLTTQDAMSYRANPVESSDPSLKKLRRAMDSMRKR